MLNSPQTNSFVSDTYRKFRLMGYSPSNAKREAAVIAARAYPCTVAEARAKLDYELSRMNILEVIGNLI